MEKTKSFYIISINDVYDSDGKKSPCLEIENGMPGSIIIIFFK